MGKVQKHNICMCYAILKSLKLIRIFLSPKIFQRLNLHLLAILCFGSYWKRNLYYRAYYRFLRKRFIDKEFWHYIQLACRRRDNVGIATGYGLDDWGVGVRVPGGSRIFSTSSRPVLGSTQPTIQWVPGAPSPWVKRPGREPDHSSTASTVSAS
jgi:hypothetical protein